MERLATRFPRAHEENTPKVRFVLNDQIDRSIWPRKNLKVFIDTEEMENDTLEEIYGLCRSVYSIDVDTHSLSFFFFQGQIATSPGST